MYFLLCLSERADLLTKKIPTTFNHLNRLVEPPTPNDVTQVFAVKIPQKFQYPHPVSWSILVETGGEGAPKCSSIEPDGLTLTGDESDTSVADMLGYRVCSPSDSNVVELPGPPSQSQCQANSEVRPSAPNAWIELIFRDPDPASPCLMRTPVPKGVPNTIAVD